MKSSSTRRILLLALLAPLFTLTASADDPVEDNGIYYNLVSKGKIATVTQNPNGYSGSIAIPPTITVSGTTYSVVGIEDNAFESSSVTSVNIPESVTSIGKYAFRCCSCLTSITIPNSVTSIGQRTFSECYSLTSFIIPNSVTNINVGTFMGCLSLTSVAIPKSVTAIGDVAFSGCISLTSVIIPESVSSIGTGVFSGCSSLTSVTIPESITLIDVGTFEGCSSLTSVIIPNSITGIRERSFHGCSSLTSIVLPKVSYVEENAFYGCTQLRSVTFEINDHTRIGSQAFANCSNLEEFTISTYYEMGPDDWWIAIAESDAFEESFVEYATLYVPASAISLYKADAVWSQFGTIKALGSASKYYKLIVDVNAKGTVVYGDGENAKTITGTSQTFYVKENENVELTLTPNVGCNLGSVTVNGVDMTATVVNDKLTFLNVNSDLTVNVKFVFDANTVGVTIGQLGVATFCEKSLAMDFSCTNDVKAYIVSAFNPATGQVTLTRIMDVPVGTGIVLLGSAGTYRIPLSTDETDFINMLVGVTADKVLNKTEGANSNFILSDGENGVGFYPVKDGSTLAAGKAYLSLPTASLPSNAQSFSLRFDDATGIRSMLNDREEAGAWYTLDGRRLDAQPTAKGLYIVNGKKVIVR